MRSRILFNTGREFRPALVVALALVVIAGGGTAANLSVLHSRSTVHTSATVNDLQSLDKNEQAIQTMDQLFQDDNPNDDQNAQPET
jgi:hypothetical protein